MNKKVIRKMMALVMALAMTMGLPVCASAAGEGETDWPNRTVTICTGGTGGSNDYGARLWAQYMSDAWGVNFIVQNFDVTVDAVRQMANQGDDHILFFDNITQLIKHSTGMFELGLEDYKTICFTCAHPGSVLAVRADSGIETLEDFYNYCEEHPYEVNLSDQLGSSTGVCVKGLVDAGFKVNRVETGDTGERITSLLGGHLDAIIGPYGTVGPYEESGDLKILCPFREERNEHFDFIPTAKESGYDISVEVPFTLLGNNNLSDEACQKISDFVGEICATEEYTEEIFNAQKWSVFFKGFEEAEDYLQTQYDWFVTLDLLS